MGKVLRKSTRTFFVSFFFLYLVANPPLLCSLVFFLCSFLRYMSHCQMTEVTLKLIDNLCISVLPIYIITKLFGLFCYCYFSTGSGWTGGLPIDLSCQLLFSHFYVDHTCSNSTAVASICCYVSLIKPPPPGTIVFTDTYPLCVQNFSQNECLDESHETAFIPHGCDIKHRIPCSVLCPVLSTG